MMKKVDTFRSVEYVSLRMGWGQIRDKMTIHLVLQITVRIQLNKKEKYFLDTFQDVNKQTWK